MVGSASSAVHFPATRQSVQPISRPADPASTVQNVPGEGIGNIFDFIRPPGSSPGGGTGTAGFFNQAKTGIDAFGGNLGFANPNPGFIGPPTASQAALGQGGGFTSGFGGSSASLSGILGGAGIGATVGTLNPFAKNRTGSQIGGTIGGAIGTAFGPIGTFVGSALGSLVGGALGKTDAPVHASQFSGTIGAGGIENFNFAGKRAGPETANQVSNLFGDYAKELQQSTGIDLTGKAIQGGFNDRFGGGFFIREGGAGKLHNFDPNDPESVRTAFNTFAKDVLLKDRNLSEEQAAAIDAFDPQGERIRRENLAAGRSAEGVPLLGGLGGQPTGSATGSLAELFSPNQVNTFSVNKEIK